MEKELVIDKFHFPTLYKCLYNYYQHFKSVYINNLKNSNRIASGELIKSIDVDIEANGKMVNVKLKLLPYWEYIEFGRLPTEKKGDGTVVDRIESWISHKGLAIPNDMTKRQFAYAITNSIHKYGFQGSRDLQNTIYEVNDKWTEAIKAALLADIKMNLTMIQFK